MTPCSEQHRKSLPEASAFCFILGINPSFLSVERVHLGLNQHVNLPADPETPLAREGGGRGAASHPCALPRPWSWGLSDRVPPAARQMIRPLSGDLLHPHGGRGGHAGPRTHTHHRGALPTALPRTVLSGGHGTIPGATGRCGASGMDSAPCGQTSAAWWPWGTSQRPPEVSLP